MSYYNPHKRPYDTTQPEYNVDQQQQQLPQTRYQPFVPPGFNPHQPAPYKARVNYTQQQQQQPSISPTNINIQPQQHQQQQFRQPRSYRQPRSRQPVQYNQNPYIQHGSGNTINYHSTVLCGYPLDLYPLLMSKDVLPNSDSDSDNNKKQDNDKIEHKTNNTTATITTTTGSALPVPTIRKTVLDNGLIADNVTIDSEADAAAIAHLQKLSGSYNKKVKKLTSQEEQLLQLQKYNSDNNTSYNWVDITQPIQSLSTDPVSPVIHFRNVSDTIDESDIQLICNQFGPVVKTVIIRHKHQAMCQFQHINYAISMINHYINTNTVPIIKNTKLYCRYSQHQAIIENDSKNDKHNDNSDKNITPNNIISIIIKCDIDPEQNGYCVTVDLLYNIFSIYGTVHKIVIVKKFDWQGFIQYTDIDSAKLAYIMLNTKSVYIDTNTLSKPLELQINISYSTLKDLNIKVQGYKSKDFILQQAQLQVQQQQQQMPQQQMQQQIQQSQQQSNQQHSHSNNDSNSNDDVTDQRTDINNNVENTNDTSVTTEPVM